MITKIDKQVPISADNQISYRETLLEQIMSIDTNDISDLGEEVSTRIVEEQKVYFWSRLYLKDENPNIEVGDDITIKYTPSGEELKTKFVCYGKQGLNMDYTGEMRHYVNEDDRRLLCLLVDSNEINKSDSIPFLRTLFKSGYHYEDQIYRRNEIQFVVDKNNIILEYVDCDF